MKDSTPEVVFQKVKANIPDDLKGPLVTFYFIKPWFFIREDLFFECWRKNWLQEKFGVSRWRLFRAIFLRKKQSFKLPAICEYIFFKHGAVRYFDLNADICFKVLLQKKTKERSLWLKEIEGRNLFSKHVLTLQVLDQGHNFIVEPIARGVRVLEFDIIKERLYVEKLAQTMVDILTVKPCSYRRVNELKAIFSFFDWHKLGVHPLEDCWDQRDELKVTLCHGDFQIHNLFWFAEEEFFMVIDWEQVDNYPIFWDAYLFLNMLLNKRGVLNSKYLISLYVKRRDYIFNNLVQFFRMSNNDIVRQFICCEEIYLSRHGEVEYVRYGSDIVDKKLSLLRGFIDK